MESNQKKDAKSPTPLQKEKHRKALQKKPHTETYVSGKPKEQSQRSHRVGVNKPVVAAEQRAESSVGKTQSAKKDQILCVDERTI